MRVQPFLPLFLATLVYLSQKRLGMSIVAYLLIALLLREGLARSIKTWITVALALILFGIGQWASLALSLHVAVLQWEQIWSFTGGFLNGMVELGSFVLITLLPLKLWLSRNLTESIRYILKLEVVWLPIAGLIQGSYMAGWHQFYI